jgi:hypothetical protein
VRISTVLSVAILVIGGALPVTAGSLRHVEYAVSSNLDGPLRQGKIALDLTDVAPDRTFGFDIADDLRDPLDSQFHVRLDERGSAGTRDAVSLSDEEEALLYFFALSNENLTGVARGDRWTRNCPLTDGSQETRFTVLRASGLVLDLGVTRAVTRADGTVEGWQGHLLYDAAAVVPLTIELRGRDPGDPSAPERSLTFRLTGDSFTRDVQSLARPHL